MSENFEPIRSRVSAAGNHWSNSGKLKRKFRGEAHETSDKRHRLGHMKRVRRAKVSKRLRRLLDGA